LARSPMDLVVPRLCARRLATRLVAASAATLSGAGARALARRSAICPTPALPPGLFAHRPDEREHRVEEPVEPGPVALVLHQRRRERLAQDPALDAGGSDGGDRVERLRDRHVDAALAERLDELEDARAHPGPC